MAHGERCVLCARWRQTTVGPLRESIETPLDCRSIFSPAVWSESIRGVRFRFLCAAPVAKAMSSQKLAAWGPAYVGHDKLIWSWRITLGTTHVCGHVGEAFGLAGTRYISAASPIR